MQKSSIIAVAVVLVLFAAGLLLFYGKSDKSDNNDGGGASAPPQTESNQNTSEMNNNKINKQGVEIEILKEGTGEAAKNGDAVSVHYVGVLENGTKFDSSVDRGVPFEFTIGARQVIPGWEIGIEGMKIGEVRNLAIPPELAYGAAGAGGVIPPNATLIFQVQLLSIK